MRRTSPLILTLKKQLAKTFPAHNLDDPDGLCIHFEKHPHLRFELGEPHPNGSDERVRQSADRAAYILETCFRPADPVFLLATFWGKSIFGGDPEYLHTLLDHTALIGAARRKLHEEERDRRDGAMKIRRWEQHIYLMPFAAMNHRQILAGIANKEQGKSPKVTQSVFFIHAKKPVAFHMYDDRGCLLFAHPATLAELENALKPGLGSASLIGRQLKVPAPTGG